MKCMHCSHGKDESCIKRVPIFNSLTKEEQDEISKTITHKSYNKGEIIYLAGEKTEQLFIINEGKVKVTKITDTGKEQIIRILSVGDFIDEISIFTNSISNNNAEAIEKTTMCIIGGKDIKSIIEKNQSIALKILKELGTRLEKAESLIESIGLRSVEKRIADILLEMANEKDVVNLILSKKDLASHIGMSQESLSRKLSSFQHKGWITLEGQRKIIIKNREKLESIKETP